MFACFVVALVVVVVDDGDVFHVDGCLGKGQVARISTHNFHCFIGVPSDLTA